MHSFTKSVTEHNTGQIDTLTHRVRCMYVRLSSRRLRASRRRAFCVVKEDGTELGRTQASEIIRGTGDNTILTEIDSKASAITTDGLSLPETVSWEGGSHHDTNLFAVTLSPHRGGGLPLQLTIELWEVSVEGGDDDPTTSRLAPPIPNSAGGDRRATRISPARAGKGHSVRRIGSAGVGPDTLVLSLPGRLTLPLEVSPSKPKGVVRVGDGVGNGDRAAGADQPAQAETAGSEALPPKIMLRVTPQVGVHWGRRVKAAAAVAKRVSAPPRPAEPLSLAEASVLPITGSGSSASTALKNGSNGLAHVVYMTNAEGSARTWRAPVTPGSSIPPKDYEDVLELVFGSVPACCPQAPALLVAPISDIGVQLGQSWIGPRVAARHALVAHRPNHYTNASKSSDTKGNDNDNKKDGAKATSTGDVHSIVAIEPPREDELFMRMVAAEAEGLLRELRAGDMRAEQRRMALERVREVCDTWTQARAKATASQHQTDTFDNDMHKERGKRRRGLTSTDVQEVGGDGIDCDGDGGEHSKVPDGGAGYSGDDAERVKEGDDADDEDDDHLGGRACGDLYRGVLRALEMALPGVSIYVGILERGGESIRYVACTKQSSMAGKQLKKGEGISFCCVGPNYAPYVVYPPRHSGGPKRGNTRSTASQSKRTTRREEEEESFSIHRMADVVDAAMKGENMSSSRSKRTGAERSMEEVAVSIQKAFRGKRSRDRMGHSQPSGVSRNNRSALMSKKPHSQSKTSALLIPRVFDYEGRVGWPFVCVPLEGFLRSSSIGVLGLDTFEQMGNSGSGRHQPEAGVVQMVQEAARCAYGYCIS